MLCIGALGMPAVRVAQTEEALLGPEFNDETLQAALLALRKELVPASKSSSVSRYAKGHRTWDD